MLGASLLVIYHNNIVFNSKKSEGQITLKEKGKVDGNSQTLSE